MSDQKKDDKEKKPLKNWAVLTGIGIQMGATIFICAWIGKKLDEKYSHGKNWFTIGCVIFGVFSSLYVVLQQVKKLNQ